MTWEGPPLRPSAAVRTATEGTPGSGQWNDRRGAAGPGGRSGSRVRASERAGRRMVDAGIALLPRPDGTRPAQDGPDKLHRFLLAPSLMTDSRATTSRFAPFAIAVACLCLAACRDDGAAEPGADPAAVVPPTTLAMQPGHARPPALA